MVNERRRGSPEDQPEPDSTLIQPKKGKGREADAASQPDQTLIQGSARPPVDPGDTMAQRGFDRTIEVGGAREPDRPEPPTKKDRSVAGKIFASRFEVIEKLGEGGMGVVYRARDREIEGREIALKVLRPRFSRNARFRELFFKEIHAAQGFVSENVVQVRDTGKAEDGTLFLTMDLVDGEPLDDVLLRENALHERHALEIARQTLLALGSGHDKGFVHRDIKPSNVMLARRIAKSEDNPFGVGVRLLDFGIASLTAQLEEGQVIGTPRYMSPEQVQGQRLDGRSDLFSVGILLYEMLSGTRPFEGDTPEELRTAILETNIAPLITELDNLSEPIRKILGKALQKNRDKRFQSAAEFVQAIEKSRAFREKRGMPAWAGGALFLFMAGAGGLGWVVYDQRNTIDGLRERLGGIEGTHAQAIVGLEAKYKAEIGQYENEREQLRVAKAKAEAELKTKELAADEAEKDRANEIEARRQKEREAAALEIRVANLERELRDIRRDIRPEVVAAKFLDHVVGLIDMGSALEAKSHLDARLGRGEVDVPEGQGASHIRSLIEAAAALQSAANVLLPPPGQEGSAPPPPTAEQLEKALQDYNLGVDRLTQATKTAATFEQAAEKWIGEQPEAGSGETAETGAEPGTPEQAEAMKAAQRKRRLEELARARDKVAEQAEALKVRIDAINEVDAERIAKEIEELQKTKRTDDPAPLIKHLRTHAASVEKLGPTLARLANETEKHCAPGGQLDADRLAESSSIAKWGELVQAGGAALAPEVADTWRWLSAAQRWLRNSEPDDNLAGPAFAFLDELPKTTKTQPYADWRAQLALQRAFARNLDTFLEDGSGAAVYRNKSIITGSWTWFLERVKTDAGSRDRGVIERARVDDEGHESAPDEIPIALRDGILDIAHNTALNVHDNGEHVRVALWKPSLVVPLPNQTWTRSMQHKQWQRRVENGLPCLVVEAGTTQYWFSPGYGIVRLVIPDVFERELCYSARTR